MKAHNAWQIDFKRDIPIRVFSLFLKAVQKARSAFGLTYTETRKAICIQYTQKKRLIRELLGLGQITREALTFSRKEEGKRKCNLQQRQTFSHPIYAKDIPSFGKVPLHFYK